MSTMKLDASSEEVARALPSAVKPQDPRPRVRCKRRGGAATGQKFVTADKLE